VAREDDQSYQPSNDADDPDYQRLNSYTASFRGNSERDPGRNKPKDYGCSREGWQNKTGSVHCNALTDEDECQFQNRIRVHTLINCIRVFLVALAPQIVGEQCGTASEYRSND